MPFSGKIMIFNGIRPGIFSGIGVAVRHFPFSASMKERMEEKKVAIPGKRGLIGSG